MNTRIQIIALALVAAFGVLSCAKNDDANPDDKDDVNGHLNGKLIYSFTGNVYQLDLQTNQQSMGRSITWIMAKR